MHHERSLLSWSQLQVETCNLKLCRCCAEWLSGWRWVSKGQHSANGYAWSNWNVHEGFLREKSDVGSLKFLRCHVFSFFPASVLFRSFWLVQGHHVLSVRCSHMSNFPSTGLMSFFALTSAVFIPFCFLLSCTVHTCFVSLKCVIRFYGCPKF